MSNPPKINWEAVEGASKYVIQKSNSRSFANAKTFNTNQLNNVLRDPAFGEYYFRVKALGDKNTKPSKYSKVAKIKVRSRPPELKEYYEFVKKVENNDDLNIKNMKVDLQWSEVPFIENYDVKISKSSDFNENILERKVASTNFEANLEAPGNYFIKARAIDSTGSPLSKYSEPSKISLINEFLLKAPDLKTPENDSHVFNLGDQKVSLIFKWKKAELADTYDVEIAKDKNFKILILQKNTKNALHLVKMSLKPGPIYWRVKTRLGEKQSDWSETRIIVIESFLQK